MNPLLKHITVRLWLTALLGGALCFFAMPLWQRFFGLDWLALPAALALTFSFGAVGWALNQTGTRIAGRYINEAAVWERAGMDQEAESALERAAALFDSFWLSPLMRRQRTPWFTAILSRFYLGQTAHNSHARKMVAAYLRYHPDDETLAAGWLEQLLNRERHTPQEYEAAARISETHGGHGRIQQLLMQFHLANGRSDFAAMQTYQHIWQQHTLAPELVHELARLLLNEGALSHWSLQVYLSDFQSGHQDAVDGIAAAVQWLRPTVENRKDLAAAREAVGEIANNRIERLARRFKPVEDAATTQTRSVRRIKKPAKRTAEIAKEMALSGKNWMRTATSRSMALGSWVRGLTITRSMVIAVSISASVFVLVALGWKFSGEVEAPAVPVPEQQIIPVIEPFTIQVAAYVHTDDAQRFVDRLKQVGLEAFWTKATSADRTWYQVKVGHFETKEQAMRYGQELKTKGIIDDFYVANYKKPKR